MQAIRIVIADDHPVFRFGLRALLNAMPDTEVVGEVSTGEEVLAMAGSVRPDVILMVTMLEDDSVFAAMRAGARGYVVKGADPTEVLRAIRAVADGEAIFSPGIAERLIRYFTSPPVGAGDRALPAEAPIFPELTERERDVLKLIAQGLTNSAIAEQLLLSPKTVRNHISNIFSKLQVADRAEAIARAREAGMGRDIQ